MNARLQHAIDDFIGPGQQQYRVLEKLVSGGMGTVYRVENMLTGNIYAVKECDVLDDPDGRELSRAQALEVFLTEGREVERLQHPNIPRGFLLAHEDLHYKVCGQCGMVLPEEAVVCPQKPLDGGPEHPLQEIRRRLYLFMDFIDGVDAVVASRHMPKPLSAENLETVKRWLVQACEALAFLHGRGLIHRDVKPENLRITKERAYLLDFGLVAEEPESSKTRRLNLPTAFHGTKGYAPGEQVYGHPRRASDSFALAMTFFSLATGEDPSHDEVQKRFCEKDPRDLVPGISEALAECLEKARGVRSEIRPTMDEWIEVLSQTTTMPVYVGSRSETRRLRPGTSPVRRGRAAQKLRPGAEKASWGKGKQGKLRPGGSESGGWRRSLPSFRVSKWIFPHAGKVLLVLVLVILSIWLWPRNSHLTFQAEALPGATIYKDIADLRQGRILKGGEVLKVRHAENGHEGNWLMVISVDGKRATGYLLRSKVFRGRS